MDYSNLSLKILEIYNNFALENAHLEEWETMDKVFRTLNANYFSKSALELSSTIICKYASQKSVMA